MLRKSQNNNHKVEKQRTYSEVSDKRGNLQPLSLVVLGETTGLFYCFFFYFYQLKFERTVKNIMG
ncbi:hypothetical protein D7V21_11970 [Acinetobacter guerrae]|uniref:Uncharacterized protein n=1 Tax=Acinetobacter guerrae TaxID=1843371 RepID=A0A3A8EBX8_9GAMM|nr:hypothetical protein D7V21_11970 [Acinetobacter guerrae]